MADIITEIEEMLPDGINELPDDIARELQKEIQRNEEAVRLMKQKQVESEEAKMRADNSRKQMENMTSTFEDMKKKLELTKQTLAHTKVRIESHELLKAKVQHLKNLANDLSERQRRQLLPEGVDMDRLRKYVKPDYARTIESLSEKLETDGNDFMKSVAILEEEKNEAVLKATEKEENAKIALKKALERENEAKAMKERFSLMTQLLTEEQNKLSATENKIEKKANVVDKVNKILNSKERRVKYVESQKMKALIFDQKAKK
ncbi:uncharacterized protein [Lepeophtheirus salmonis]|uniref:uncharacterized protein n=1 Tax=Lepeophtheirus salmonis TaxID=72036 RepID=UPI001AE1C8DD|nr:myosin-3-like [Lepeophtheirus salmonis]